MRGSLQTDRKRAVLPPACYPESMTGSGSSAGFHPAALWETKAPRPSWGRGMEQRERSPLSVGQCPCVTLMCKHRPHKSIFLEVFSSDSSVSQRCIPVSASIVSSYPIQFVQLRWRGVCQAGHSHLFILSPDLETTDILCSRSGWMQAHRFSSHMPYARDA